MGIVELGAESPNQRQKQQLIVEAARSVLAREGLAGCTARAVADASPLTKSALHYYFDDIGEIIDRAMGAHLDAMLDKLRGIADSEADPTERLWRVIDAYLATFAETPQAALLWFEYWIALSRRGTTSPVAQNLDAIRVFLSETLQQANHTDPDAAAHTLLSWLLGTVVQQNVAPRPGHTRRHELEHLLRLPPN